MPNNTTITKCPLCTGTLENVTSPNHIAFDSSIDIESMAEIFSNYGSNSIRKCNKCLSCFMQDLDFNH
jgi:hypothetical protein